MTDSKMKGLAFILESLLLTLHQLSRSSLKL